jgi:hypothetical protein
VANWIRSAAGNWDHAAPAPEMEPQAAKLHQKRKPLQALNPAVQIKMAALAYWLAEVFDCTVMAEIHPHGEGDGNG